MMSYQISSAGKTFPLGSMVFKMLVLNNQYFTGFKEKRFSPCRPFEVKSSAEYFAILILVQGLTVFKI